MRPTLRLKSHLYILLASWRHPSHFLQKGSFTSITRTWLARIHPWSTWSPAWVLVSPWSSQSPTFLSTPCASRSHISHLRFFMCTIVYRYPQGCPTEMIIKFFNKYLPHLCIHLSFVLSCFKWQPWCLLRFRRSYITESLPSTCQSSFSSCVSMQLSSSATSSSFEPGSVEFFSGKLTSHPFKQSFL